MRTFVLLIILFHLVLAGCHRSDKSGTTAGETVILVVEPLIVPVFPEKQENAVLTIGLNLTESDTVLSELIVSFSDQDGNRQVESGLLKLSNLQDEASLPGPSLTANRKQLQLAFNGNLELNKGVNQLTLFLKVKPDANIESILTIEGINVKFQDGTVVAQEWGEQPLKWRLGRLLRATGQDNCDTYRIPGLVTTNNGTLIAVYDNRYNNSKDLQEDIDIGMSRSTDGGQTWETMKVIMDMGQWGGLPQELNGVGDPCVLYDHHTHTIWVAALWLHGSAKDKMAWWDSKPGIKPGETSQFLLVKSSDDGLSWSDPINITGQIKQPEWQLLLQGPGRGITLKDGTLVFPAQFKADIGEKAIDGGQYTCHSTIVYSKDCGTTWQVGSGAKPNTTEAQVVELADGGLMLNMRDDLNRHEKGDHNGRAVTYDMGATWQIHSSSNLALQEPNCMASIIAYDTPVAGEIQQVLFFSNPNSKTERTHMTIKTSFDGGTTWPESNQVELYAPAGYGYSCMSMVNENMVGTVYEGVKELYFQKVPVSELVKE